MVNLSEGICSELFSFLRIFESQYGNTGLEITDREVTEQLFKLYENLTERYRARLHRLERGSKDNSFQQIVAIFDHAKARSLNPLKSETVTILVTMLVPIHIGSCCSDDV